MDMIPIAELARISHRSLFMARSFSLFGAVWRCGVAGVGFGGFWAKRLRRRGLQRCSRVFG
jgi:hypothetical protein